MPAPPSSPLSASSVTSSSPGSGSSVGSSGGTVGISGSRGRGVAVGPVRDLGKPRIGLGEGEADDLEGRAHRDGHSVAVLPRGDGGAEGFGVGFGFGAFVDGRVVGDAEDLHPVGPGRRGEAVGEGGAVGRPQARDVERDLARGAVTGGEEDDELVVVLEPPGGDGVVLVVGRLGPERRGAADAFVEHLDKAAARELVVLPIIAEGEAAGVDHVDAEDGGGLGVEFGVHREEFEEDGGVFEAVGAFGEAVLPEVLEIGVGAGVEVGVGGGDRIAGRVFGRDPVVADLGAGPAADVEGGEEEVGAVSTRRKVRRVPCGQRPDRFVLQEIGVVGLVLEVVLDDVVDMGEGVGGHAGADEGVFGVGAAGLDGDGDVGACGVDGRVGEGGGDAVHHDGCDVGVVRPGVGPGK